MSMTTASVVGIPSKSSWSTTASLRLPSAELWCVCGFSGSEASPHTGRHFITFLEELSANSAQDVYQSVTEYLQKTNGSTAYSIALVYRSHTSVLLLTFGFGIIGFHRPLEGFRWLMDGTQEHAVLEGGLQSGDTFFLATTRFRDLNFPLEKYVQLPIHDLSADLFPRVQRQSHSGEIAALFVRDEVAPGEANSDQEKTAVTTPPTSDTANDAVESVDTATTRNAAAASASHLISPEKIRAGVEAAQVTEFSARSPRQFQPKWFHRVQDFNWRQLHLIRVVVVLVVVVGILGGLVWYRSWNVNQEYESVVVPLEQLVAEVSQEEDRFEQRSASESLLERIRATRLSYNANQRRLRELEAEVQTVFDAVSGQKNIVNLPVFYDFRLVSSNFLATKVARQLDRAFFLDVNQNQVISLDLTSKQNETIPLQDVAQPIDITTLGSRLYFLNNDGVQSTTLSGSDVQTDITFDDDVEDPSQAASFGENIYVLDRGAQQIWRASVSSEDASPSGWVRSAAGVDFSTVSSMAINGSIWLGSNSGDVYELALGARENFQFTGLPEPFTSSVLVAANEEGEKLIVVEPSRGRVVVFQKETGEYLQQITSEQIGAVTDVILNEEENLVFLLAGSVVYRVEI